MDGCCGIDWNAIIRNTIYKERRGDSKIAQLENVKIVSLSEMGGFAGIQGN